MSVSITGPVLSSLLFEHYNSDGDREGFLLGTVTDVVTNTISDTDMNVIKHQIIYNIYSFLPLYGTTKWYDRTGAVDESSIAAILEGVSMKVVKTLCCENQDVVGWYKLRRNSSLQVSMREHAVHRHLSSWLQKDHDSASLLFMLCVSQTSTNHALCTCDHLYMIANNTSSTGYECLPETIVSLSAIAQPDYKLSPACISSEQCSYNEELSSSSCQLLDASGELKMVGEIRGMGDHLRQRLKELCGRVLESEEMVAKELAEVQHLCQQLEECRAHEAEADAMALNASAPENSVDEIQLSLDSQPLMLDSDQSDDTLQAPALWDNVIDSQEHVILLDSGDEAMSRQMPCLIPQSVVPGLSNDDQQTTSDDCMDIGSAGPSTADDVPSTSVTKPESQPFAFVNDVMKACSSNATALPCPRESDRLRSRGGKRTAAKTAKEPDIDS